MHESFELEEPGSGLLAYPQYGYTEDEENTGAQRPSSEGALSGGRCGSAGRKRKLHMGAHVKKSVPKAPSKMSWRVV